MKRIQCALAIWLLFSQAAHAAIPDPQAQYIRVYWGGFHMASLIAGWEKTPQGETLMHVVVQTYGLAKTVSKYSSDTISLSQEGVPLKFKTHFTHLKGTGEHEIMLEWKDFTLVKESNQPPEPPGKRSPVSAQQKYQAYDPLTAFFEARTKVIRGEKKFTVPMYDGRRRSELQFEVLGKRKDGTLEVTLKEIFIAGYTKREQQERSKRDITVHIYLDPKTYIPVGGEGQSPLGTAIAKLGATCKTFKECLIQSAED